MENVACRGPWNGSEISYDTEGGAIVTKGPKQPKERGATIRREIIDLMALRPVTIRDISRAVGISEKDAAAHLEHALKSAGREYVVEIDPAYCRQCGFIFSHRKKTKKPSRCPECREGSVESAVYSIRKK